MQSEFHKHTECRGNRDGSYTVKCKRGLWSVTAPTKTQATAEAVRYFIQYWRDGEYSDNPLEAFASNLANGQTDTPPEFLEALNSVEFLK